MGTPYKMKGSPMQRNFGVGSPLRDEEKPVKEGTLPTVEVSGGKGGKSRAQRDYDKKLEAQASAEYDRSRAFSDKGSVGGYSKLTDAQKLKHKRAAAERAGRIKK
tara:strand:+ start:328 stop:642 length:315 start_codon:yes stop_codon:yes gene_type:complete